LPFRLRVEWAGWSGDEIREGEEKKVSIGWLLQERQIKFGKLGLGSTISCVRETVVGETDGIRGKSEDEKDMNMKRGRACR